jgi:hypothetical protein
MTVDSPTAIAARPPDLTHRPPTAGDRGGRPRHRRLSTAQWGALGLLAALAVTLAWSGWAHRRARAETTEAVAEGAAVSRALADAERRLEDRRAALAAAEAELDDLARDLDRRSAERDELWQTSVDGHRQLEELRFLADVRAGTLLEQGAHLADLRTCLRAAEQALALSSTGSVEQGRRILDESTGACGRAEAYLERRAPA